MVKLTCVGEALEHEKFIILLEQILGRKPRVRQEQEGEKRGKAESDRPTRIPWALLPTIFQAARVITARKVSTDALRTLARQRVLTRGGRQHRERKSVIDGGPPDTHGDAAEKPGFLQPTLPATAVLRRTWNCCSIKEIGVPVNIPFGLRLQSAPRMQSSWHYSPLLLLFMALEEWGWRREELIEEGRTRN